MTIYTDLHQIFSLTANYKNCLYVTVSNNEFNLNNTGSQLLTYLKTVNAKRIIKNNSFLELKDVECLYQNSKINNVDCIIAIGDDTVMNSAKFIALAFSNNLNSLKQIANNQNNLKNSINMIFVPTTCGSGVEATDTAFIFDNKKSISISDNSLIPNNIILDPNLLENMPPTICHSCYLDALSQAIESMWSINATLQSIKYAKDAIKYILNALSNYSYNTCGFWNNLQQGAFLSGQAVNIAKTVLPHAISESLTAYYQIPHGLSVFITLPEIVKLFNIQSLSTVYNDLYTLFNVNNISELQQKLKAIMSDDGKCHTTLNKYGLHNNSDTSLIASETVVSKNYPITISKSQIETILNAILD